MSAQAIPTLTALGFLLLSPLACSKHPAGDPPSGPSEATPAAAQVAEATVAPAPAGKEDAQKMFLSRCAVCHGEKGTGDGPGAAALNPKPRNYTDADWQAKVTDDQIRSVILMGGAAVGKSPIMPASPDLQSQPELVDGLVKIVRAFKRG